MENKLIVSLSPPRSWRRQRTEKYVWRADRTDSGFSGVALFLRAGGLLIVTATSVAACFVLRMGDREIFNEETCYNHL